MGYRRLGFITSADLGEPVRQEGLRGISIDPGDRIFIASDHHVSVLGADRHVSRQWPTQFDVGCIGVAADGVVGVGELDQIELFDSEGGLLRRWGDPDRLREASAVAVSGDSVFVADARRRSILRYDRSGKFLNEIGRDNTTEGFLIPNGRLDFKLDAEGILHAVNPGKHRIERYRADGTMVSRFGRFDGRDPQGFSGCCNPTGIALMRSGGWIVTEKAPPLVKLYDRDGMLRAHWGADDFDPMCRNLDSVIDTHELVYVLDPVRSRIVVFQPTEGADVHEASILGAATGKVRP